MRPDLRRRGVARALMDEVVARAAAIGYATLYLETGPRQPAARALYAGLGWELVDAYPEGAHTHDSGTRFRLELAPSQLRTAQPPSHRASSARNGSRPMGPRRSAKLWNPFRSNAPPSRERASSRACSQTRSPTL